MKKKKIILILIIIIVLTLIGILLLKNTKKEEKVTKTVLNEDVLISLRQIIPRISKCNNEYLYKQFNGNRYSNVSFSKEKMSDYNDCSKNIKVYSLNYKYETSYNNIYIYDYILLSDGKKYGYNYKKLKNEKIELINNEISDDIIKKYGSIYRFEFVYDNGAYEYIRTVYID